MASGMLIWGQTVLQPHLHGIVFLIYWMTCFAFAFASIIIALMDVRAMLRNIKHQRATLVKRAAQSIEQPDETRCSNFAE